MFVFLSATSRKNTEMYLCTSKSPLSFGIHPDLDPDLGIFKMNFCRDGAIQQILLIIREVVYEFL